MEILNKEEKRKHTKLWKRLKKSKDEYIAFHNSVMVKRAKEYGRHFHTFREDDTISFDRNGYITLHWRK